MRLVRVVGGIVEITEDRIKVIEKAYEEIQKRGWGYSSNGQGFGDPHASWTAVGPWDGTMVNVYAMDRDPVEAVRKAIEKERMNGSS